MRVLQTYLSDNQLSPSDLARRLNCSVSTVTRLLKGERKPGLTLAQNIHRVTGIPVRDLRPDIYRVIG